MLQAIETLYKGYRFRSRLEARWAIFFDVMGIKWEYEIEGFVLGRGKTYYLPDFWLPQVRMWVEVKPAELSSKEKRKAKMLARASQRPVLMLIGTPDFKNYWAFEPDVWSPEILEMDYTLITKMLLKGEDRFPCMNFLPDGYPYLYPDNYHAAVSAARQARFEYGENNERYTAA